MTPAASNSGCPHFSQTMREVGIFQPISNLQSAIYNLKFLVPRHQLLVPCDNFEVPSRKKIDLKKVMASLGKLARSVAVRTR